MRTKEETGARAGSNSGRRRPGTWIVPFVLAAAVAGCRTASERSESSAMIEPDLATFEQGASAGEGLTIFPGCWETVGQELLPTVVRTKTSTLGSLESGFRVADPEHRALINVPARSRLEPGSNLMGDWVGSFLVGPVREASDTTIQFYRQDSQFKLVDYHAWPVVLRPSILRAVHVVRLDQVLGQPADPTRARFTVWVELDPLEEHLTFDPRPYRHIEFSPSVRNRHTNEAQVRAKHFGPGAYRGPLYWGAEAEVEVYEVSVQLPDSAAGSTSILEIQVESGGDVEHARVQF